MKKYTFTITNTLPNSEAVQLADEPLKTIRVLSKTIVDTYGEFTAELLEEATLEIKDSHGRAVLFLEIKPPPSMEELLRAFRGAI